MKLSPNGPKYWLFNQTPCIVAQLASMLVNGPGCDDSALRLNIAAVLRFRYIYNWFKTQPRLQRGMFHYLW